MKSYYKPSVDKYAGFCATLNNTINICLHHYNIFNNYDVLLKVPEIDEIFDYKASLNAFNDSDYTYDIASDFKYGISQKYDNSSNAHVIADKEKITKKNSIFENIFILKNNNLYEEERLKFINDKTLAIQLRGTDKSREVTPPNFQNIKKNIDEMLLNNDIDNIFLATDDMVYQNFLISEYGDIVKFRNKTISKDGNPIHFIEDRTLINFEVMLDVYLLSKANYFLYTFSNVSYAALTLGINNFKKINCLN